MMGRKNHTACRQGTSSLEILVAFSLLVTVLGTATPLVVRNARLLSAHRQYCIALDELSNQLERLTALPEAELPAAIERLVPSDFASARLPSAELRGELAAEDFGTRVTLHISWNEPQRRQAPVTLSAWVMPSPRVPSEEGDES